MPSATKILRNKIPTDTITTTFAAPTGKTTTTVTFAKRTAKVSPTSITTAVLSRMKIMQQAKAKTIQIKTRLYARVMEQKLCASGNMAVMAMCIITVRALTKN